MLELFELALFPEVRNTETFRGGIFSGFLPRADHEDENGNYVRQHIKKIEGHREVAALDAEADDIEPTEKICANERFIRIPGGKDDEGNSDPAPPGCDIILPGRYVYQREISPAETAQGAPDQDVDIFI